MYITVILTWSKTDTLSTAAIETVDKYLALRLITPLSFQSFIIFPNILCPNNQS